MTRSFALSFALCLALVGLAPAQGADFSEAVQPEVFTSLQRYNAEYVILPGDQLEIAVLHVPDMSKTVIVRPDGFVTLPGVKDVSLVNLTIPQAIEKVTGLYGQRLVDPDVTVTVMNPREASVFVVGEVARPGPLPFRSAPTAAQALAQSGGVVRSASMGGIAIVRLEKDGHLTARAVQRANGGEAGFYAALQQAVLAPGDIIVVKESGRSKFSRFVQDFINTPLSGANQLLAPYFQFRVLSQIN